VHIALWNTGYWRGFGGTEQMINALLRRFSLQGLKSSIIADGNWPLSSALPCSCEISIFIFS
jgi:hypothetical protein